MEKAIPKHRPAKNPASQKAKPSPSKNRFKFQNNNPKNGASAARALLFWNVYRFFVGLCLAFWLAGFFAGLCFGMTFSMDCWLTEKAFFEKRPKKYFSKQRSKTKLIFSDTQYETVRFETYVFNTCVSIRRYVCIGTAKLIFAMLDKVKKQKVLNFWKM